MGAKQYYIKYIKIIDLEQKFNGASNLPLGLSFVSIDLPRAISKPGTGT
jgi:hypothetical protein